MIPCDKAFGKCRRCGAVPVGGYETPTGADASESVETQADQELIRFRGEWMCDMCKHDIINDEQSDLESEKARDSESFREKIGYTNSVE